jgi:hypothetical protein
LEPKSARQLFPCFDGELWLVGWLEEIESFSEAFPRGKFGELSRKTFVGRLESFSEAFLRGEWIFSEKVSKPQEKGKQPRNLLNICSKLFHLVLTSIKYISAAFPPNSHYLSSLSDHIFRTPFDITVSRREDMTTESSPDLEDKEVMEGM